MMKKLSSILLVDDDSDTNMITSYFINKDALAENIATALNGEEALDYLKNNPAPDLVLLDLNMPRMNGWEFLDEYDKLDPNIKQLSKVVITSASSNPEDKERAKHRNLDFISKPVTSAILKTIIINHWG